MEKIAIVELNTYEAKLSFVNIIRNKAYNICKEYSMPLTLLKDFYPDYIINSAQIKEVLSVFQTYKKVIDKVGVDDIIAVSSNILNSAKNYNSFINEVQNVFGFRFRIVDNSEGIKLLYSAVINTMNRPKGVIVNINEDCIQFQLYNRRNFLDTFTIPFGLETLDELTNSKGLVGDKKYEEIRLIVLDKINADAKFIFDLQDDFEVIGAGNVFKNLSTICMRAIKYPLNLVHNFELKKCDFEKVSALIKNTDNTKLNKIKGLTIAESKYLPVGMAIIDAVFSKINKDKIAVCGTGVIDGLLLNYVIPLTEEKPISDSLGYSIQSINEFYDPKPNNAEKVYELALILVKQLKVLHKLNRMYVKVLRIASFLYDSGFRINTFNQVKDSFDVIINSNIYGATHNEIVLAGFVASTRDVDNFNLSLWVKYKDLVSEEDLVAVKRLAMLLKLAESLDALGFGSVADISCDILGDSVIMKTIVSSDASFEIRATMNCQNDFKKTFNKNLQVL